MNELVAVYMFLSVVIVAFAAVTVRFPKSPLVKKTVRVCAVAFILVAPCILSETLSYARPLWLEQKRLHILGYIFALPSRIDAKVVSWDKVEDIGIFVLVKYPWYWSTAPTYLSLPWSAQQAQRLEEAIEETKQKGGSIMMLVLPGTNKGETRDGRYPLGDRSIVEGRDEPKFYVVPPASRPSKDAESPSLSPVQRLPTLDYTKI